MSIDSNALDFLLSLKLFTGADRTVIEKATEKNFFVRKTFSSGQTVYSPDEKDKRLIFVFSGECEVLSADEVRSVLLRKLGRGGVIGVANLFCDDDFVSRIIAVKKCETFEISLENFSKILIDDKTVLYNYLTFLSNKICYLNKKIVCLTAGSAERRLAFYLLSYAEELDSDKFILPLHVNGLANALNLGRASLYRAFDKLTADGHILRCGKQITICDKNALQEAYE